MGFISGLREALHAGEDAFRKLCKESGTLTKEFEEGLSIAADEVGAMKATDFSRDMRAGEVRETLIKAKPEMAKVATETNAYIISMEREAKEFPEYHVNKALEKQTKLPSTLKEVSSAEDLEKVVEENSSLKNAFEKVKKKAGSAKKYIFLGAAVVGAVSIYEAIESYAKSKTGCLLYTASTGSKISVCKVLQASCLNPAESTTIPTCTPSTMGTELTKVSCSDWDSSVSACNHCSADTFDYSKLQNNQFLKCQEKADFLDAVGDLFYGMGVDISDGIASLTNIVKWILIGVAVVIVLAIFIWVFKKATHKDPVVVPQYPPQMPNPYMPYGPPAYNMPMNYYKPVDVPMNYYKPVDAPMTYYKPVDETLLKYHLLKLQNGMNTPTMRVDPYSNI